MRGAWLVGVTVLIATAPALADEWMVFPMGEGPDLRLDRSSIRRDADGAIVPWGKGWTVANIQRGAGSHASPGYFVTDCRGRYYIFDADARTGAIEQRNAQPLQVSPDSVAQQVKAILCDSAK